MGLVDVPELRELQQLAGAVGEHLLVLGFLQQRAGVLRHPVQKQEPLAGHLLGQAHQRGVHFFRAHAGEMRVQEVAQLGQRVGSQQFYNYFDAFGFTARTGVDLPSETNFMQYYRADQLGEVQLASSAFHR